MNANLYPTDHLPCVSPRSGISAIHGSNFSGRTQALRAFMQSDEFGRTAYVPIEVYNAISGLAPTVGSEILMHGGNGVARSAIGELVRLMGLADLWDRHPFSGISGGEQAMLAVVCAVALEPDALAIDGALEQIDSSRKRLLLEWLEDYSTDRVVVVVDNRIAEFPPLYDRRASLPAEAVKKSVQQLDIGAVDAARFVRPEVRNACTLTLRNIKFRYPRGVPVLQDASVELRPGGMYVLEGANGAGKSTLAKILSGVLSAERGEIAADGVIVDPWVHPGRVVGYHFQNPDVQLFNTTVAHEVGIGRGLPPKVGLFPDRTEALLSTFGLLGVRSAHPGDLPFTLRKRVALAATFAVDTPWFILDEPTLGQDDATVEQIAKVLEALCDSGAGIIVITHSPFFKARLNGGCLSLVEGRLFLGG